MWSSSKKQSAIDCKRVLSCDKVFPQDVRRLGVAYVTLHDRTRGQGNRSRARDEMSQKQPQVRLPLTWTLLSQGKDVVEKQILTGEPSCGHVVGSRDVVYFVVLGFGGVGLRRRKTPPGVS